MNEVGSDNVDARDQAVFDVGSRSGRLRWTSLSSVGLAAGASTLACLIFIRMTAQGVGSDIMLHAAIARQEVADGRWFTYTLWSPLVMIVSASGRLMSLRVASVLLLTIAVAAKVTISRQLLQRWGTGPQAAVVCAAALVVATPILAVGTPALHGIVDVSSLRGSIYLGQFSATLWHNSTSIAALPLVLLAAAAARRALETPSARLSMQMGLWLAASVLMKPNYVLAALPVLFVWMFAVNRRQNQSTWGATLRALAWCAVPSLAVLAVQFPLVRTDPFVEPSRFSWDPFVVWRYFTGSPFRSAVLSLAFPIAATVATLILRRRGQWWLWCCWLITAVAVVELALLGERSRVTGELIYSGNWFWGTHAAVMVLFMASAAALASATTHQGLSIRTPGMRTWQVAVVGAAWLVLGVHAASGGLYVWRLFHFEVGFAS